MHEATPALKVKCTYTPKAKAFENGAITNTNYPGSLFIDGKGKSRSACALLHLQHQSEAFWSSHGLAHAQASWGNFDLFFSWLPLGLRDLQMDQPMLMHTYMLLMNQIMLITCHSNLHHPWWMLWPPNAILSLKFRCQSWLNSGALWVQLNKWAWRSFCFPIWTFDWLLCNP